MSEWKIDPEYPEIEEYWVDSKRVAYMQPRPRYCDRGHWQVNADQIPFIDEADGFPRYYMDKKRAKLETEEWVAWRLRHDAIRRMVEESQKLELP